MVWVSCTKNEVCQARVGSTSWYLACLFSEIDAYFIPDSGDKDHKKRLAIFSVHVHPDGSRIATGGLGELESSYIHPNVFILQ